MAGVEILATQEVVAEWAYDWGAFMVTFGIVLIVMTIAGISVSIEQCDWSNLIICMFFGAIMGAIIGCLGGALFQDPMSYVTEYKVTVSDEVSMTEFCERYEVVDQEGKIFTVREKMIEVKR